eukprot:8734554-Pyramimonas_sp.AAC.1
MLEYRAAAGVVVPGGVCDFQGPFGQQHTLTYATPPACRRRRRLAQATPPATTNVLQVRSRPKRVVRIINNKIV